MVLTLGNNEVGAIFVIDNPGLMESLYKEFVAYGIVPVATNNADDAAEFVAGGQNRILLLDVNLPQNKDMKILKWLKWSRDHKHPSNIVPIVIFSEHIEKEVRDQAIKEGAFNVIINPKDTSEQISKQIKEVVDKFEK